MSLEPFRKCAFDWLDDIDLEGSIAEKIQELRIESVSDGVDWVRRLLRREVPSEAERLIEIIDTAFESRDECREEMESCGRGEP